MLKARKSIKKFVIENFSKPWSVLLSALMSQTLLFRLLLSRGTDEFMVGGEVVLELLRRLLTSDWTASQIISVQPSHDLGPGSLQQPWHSVLVT